MILAHFGPGVYERLGVGGTARALLDLIGRVATPAFVLIFGITLAIVYVPKSRVVPDATMRGLINRSGLVFVCSLIVTISSTVNVLMTADQPAFWFRLALAQ